MQDANNTDTPWVDQSQTYTSHSSHQVFLREYVNSAAGRPVSTGKLLGPLAALDDADGRRDDRRHLDLGVDQGAGRQPPRAAAAGQGRDQHSDDRRGSLRQVHPRPDRGCRST